MPFIDWRPTPKRNVEVMNDTADFYRYFDCTENAEFLYQCVARTIDVDLPRELDFLRRHDMALNGLSNAIDFPDRLAADFIMFVRQNGGKLARRRQRDEFAELTDAELHALEAIVNEAFLGFDEQR